MIFSLVFCAIALVSCQPNRMTPEQMTVTGPKVNNFSVTEVDKYLPVDCLLPGQIRRLGGTVYQSSRRPIKTTAGDCEIRGGEYVMHDRANYATALNAWLPQAQGGDAEAQTYVGDIYQQGLGTPPRYDRAAEWYQKAAEQGNTRAQMSLGFLYEKGLGVKKDPAQAHSWYRRASGMQDFVPAEDASLTSLERQELATLRKEVLNQKSSTDALKRQLKESNEKLDRTRQQLEQRQKVMESEKKTLLEKRHDLEKRKSSAAGIPQSELLNLDKKLAKREAELEGKYAEIQRLRAEVDQSAQEAEKYHQSLSRLQEKLSNLPPPFIEINDPTILATRSVRLAWVEPEQTTRMVAGRVWAPSGIAQFTINNREETLQPDGTFTAKVALRSSGDTEVQIIARDSRGKTGSVTFSLKAQENPGSTGPVGRTFPDVEFGNYHALIIGNDDYARLPRLQTPIKDAQEIGKILKNKYGFQVKILLNASRLEIFRTLEETLRQLNDHDNFLLYYAGHGELDPVNRRGYWLPVDADPGSREKWIPNVEITDYLNIMTAKQILVIADTCYSGIMTRSAISPMEPGSSTEVRHNFLKRLAKQHARMVLSSGEEQPVLDIGGGEHSVFAKVLIDVLQNNNEVIEGVRLHQQINERVLYRSEIFGMPQVPQYAALIPAGHQSGDFILVPQ
ncbi:caspase family protein [Desulfopila sp. IMCC35006]|uniref:caspase family protein n=1 Tax=Desulfopila sp. IMCC35006 TaxID=2569542 RepID=UPI00197B044A|nr:caspase family protein [Desulfopila sp. IMCC35006]